MKYLTVALSLLLSLNVHAQKEDKALQSKLQALVKSFNGDVGIYVRHLQNGKTVAINADSVFPTASMVKIPITIGIFDKIEKGEIDYHTELVYKDSLLYEGVDILGSFKSGEKIELGKVLVLGKVKKV